MTFREYQLFVEGVAKSKKIPVEEIRFKLCNCGPPTLGGRFQLDDAFGARKVSMRSSAINSYFGLPLELSLIFSSLFPLDAVITFPIGPFSLKSHYTGVEYYALEVFQNEEPSRRVNRDLESLRLGRGSDKRCAKHPRYEPGLWHVGGQNTHVD